MRYSMGKRIISIFLVCVMILSYSAIITGTANDDINSAKDKKSDTQNEIKETENLLEQLNKDKTDALSYINALRQKMDEIDLLIYELNQQIDEKEAQITENKAKLEQARIDSIEQYKSMKLRIQYLYEHESDTYMSALLESKDMSDMLNKAEYFSKITSYDREMLKKYVNTEKMIQETELTLQNEYTELEDAMVAVESQKNSLELVQNAMVTELNNIKNKAAEATAYEAQLKKSEKELEDKIAAMEAEAAAEAKRQAEDDAKKNSSVSLDNYNGVFVWPVPASGVSRITSGFGYRISPITGLGEGHNGIDIASSKYLVEGDQIVAAFDGIVTAAGYAGTAGNWIWINHGGGLFTVYMHLLKINVTVDQIVVKGQVIALMGGNPSAYSGNSTGAHLHFGVRLNGGYVDPRLYLKY